MWWEDSSNGDPSKWQQNTGNGWNQNKLMPIAPDPVTGQQAFHDTVVSVKPLARQVARGEGQGKGLAGAADV
jgi:hypothetical protein